jgi:DNA topoisomerase-1
LSTGDAAEDAGLHFVSDRQPGYCRRRLRNGFGYYDTAGRRITDHTELARIRSLAVPPAYTDVWICADPAGHLQATGRDARGRKQYRYHPQWRAVRDAHKFERLRAFGMALPRIRSQVARDLALKGLPRPKIVATVVRLLETTLIRVGNVEYTATNGSYGLTTLRHRHAQLSGSQVRFQFRGKSGRWREAAVSDPQVTRVIRRCMELPGQELFQYLDEEGHRHAIDSSDVNAYLHRVTGADFTAKDYRTWAGSVLALNHACKAAARRGSKAAAVKAIVEAVAAQLGNTPAVCRKAYIHPEVLAACQHGAQSQSQSQAAAKKRAGSRHLHADERALLDFLAGCEQRALSAAREGAGKSASMRRTSPRRARRLRKVAVRTQMEA